MVAKLNNNNNINNNPVLELFCPSHDSSDPTDLSGYQTLLSSFSSSLTAAKMIQILGNYFLPSIPSKFFQTISASPKSQTSSLKIIYLRLGFTWGQREGMPSHQSSSCWTGRQPLTRWTSNLSTLSEPGISGTALVWDLPHRFSQYTTPPMVQLSAYMVCLTTATLMTPSSICPSPLMLVLTCSL